MNRVAFVLGGAVLGGAVTGVTPWAGIDHIVKWSPLGQDEKRELTDAAQLAAQVAKINLGRDRLAAAKKEALARGEKW